MAVNRIINTLIFLLNIACLLKNTLAPNPDAELNRKINEIFGENNNLEVSSQGPNNSENCECVAHSLCNGNLNEDGIGIINIRTIDKKCQSYLEICCTPENITTETVRESEPQLSCGWKNSEGVGFRILGNTDNEANFGEFPWMIGILEEEIVGNFKLNKYICGGSLIHPRVVVTAAHCVSNKQLTYTARAGEWDTQTTKELIPHQDRKVENIVTHPNYHNRALHNDIALLILEKSFDLSENINVLCLPSQGIKMDSGTRCWASGWGKDKFGAEGVDQVILKKIDLPFVDSSTCQNSLRTTRLGRYFKLHESFTCAGGEAGKDTCKGDGGSPLVCPIPGQIDRYQQVGIVAWGIGCGQNAIPGVYVNVALFRNWIDTEVSKYNFDTTRYQY